MSHCIEFRGTAPARFAAALGMVLLLSALPLHADEFHYKNLLIGERAAGMGGAYTAIADTPDGCYYNPAGIAMLAGNSLSASVNAYSISQKTYESTLRQADGTYVDYVQKSSVLLPNFFGMVSSLGAGKVGFSYAVPDSTQRKQSQVFTNLQSSIAGVTIPRYTVNINDVDNTYEFGPSYARALGDDWSMGVSLYGHYRDSTVIRNNLVELSTGQFEWSNYYQYNTEWGIKPVVGVIASPLSNLSIGLSASRVFVVSAQNREQSTVRGISAPYQIGGQIYDFSDPDLVFYSNQENHDKRTLPWTTTLGLAWFPSPSLIISADLSYYSKVNDEKKATFNAALGTEYYFNDTLALRAGLYSDRTNTAEVVAGGQNQQDHVDIYAGTVSLTRFSRASSITLGLGYGHGSGEGQIIGNTTNTQDLVMQNFSGFLSAAYSF